MSDRAELLIWLIPEDDREEQDAMRHDDVKKLLQQATTSQLQNMLENYDYSWLENKIKKEIPLFNPLDHIEPDSTTSFMDELKKIIDKRS